VRHRRIFTRIQAMPPNSDVHHCAVIYVRNVANLVDTLGLQPGVDFFLYFNLAALKYGHLHRERFSRTPTATAIPARLKRDDSRRKCSIAANDGHTGLIKSLNSACRVLRLRRRFGRLVSDTLSDVC